MLEKPPVPAEPIAVISVSNRGRSARSSRTICISVITKYIIYSIFADSRILGTNLPGVGPGLSALKICTVEPFILGITASTKTRTPMPPIQWVKLRQKIRPLGTISTLGRMVEPVVVKPETVSKKQSTNEPKYPLI